MAGKVKLKIELIFDEITEAKDFLKKYKKLHKKYSFMELSLYKYLDKDTSHIDESDINDPYFKYGSIVNGSNCAQNVCTIKAFRDMPLDDLEKIAKEFYMTGPKKIAVSEIRGNGRGDEVYLVNGKLVTKSEYEIQVKSSSSQSKNGSEITLPEGRLKIEATLKGMRVINWDSHTCFIKLETNDKEIIYYRGADLIDLAHEESGTKCSFFCSFKARKTNGKLVPFVNEPTNLKIIRV